VGTTVVVLVGALGLVAVEAVSSEQSPLHDRAGHVLVVGWSRPRQRLGAQLTRPGGRRGGGHAGALGIELGALAEPSEDHPPAVPRAAVAATLWFAARANPGDHRRCPRP